MKDPKIQAQFEILIEAFDPRIEKAEKAVAKIENKMKEAGIDREVAAAWPFPTGEKSGFRIESDEVRAVRSKLRAAENKLRHIQHIKRSLVLMRDEFCNIQD